MPRYFHLEPHLTNDELEARYRGSYDPVERSHWQLPLSASVRLDRNGGGARDGLLCMYWIGQMARGYNLQGPDGVRDRRHPTGARQPDSRHVHANLRVHADSKQQMRPLLREVARAFSPRCQDRR